MGAATAPVDIDVPDTSFMVLSGILATATLARARAHVGFIIKRLS